ncbi:pilus assembly protein PilY [bacterium M00.F.Ca.ET.230.01.1.1]|nr:pilus assembly protein PilY [bacterium M00.F.Ca.ET.230.01.1.1]
MKNSLKIELTHESVGKVSFKKATLLKCLGVTFLSILSTELAQADVSKKKIGDLEIYKAAEGGNVTVMMMLDTSGSMSEPYMKTYFSSEAATACNLPIGTTYTSMNGSSIYTSTKPGSTASFGKYGCTIADTTKNVLKYFLNNEQKVTTTEIKKIYVGKYRKRTYGCFLFWCGWSSWSSVQPSMTFTSTNKESNTDGTTWYGCQADGSVNRSDCTTTATNTTTTGMTSETVNGTSSSMSTAPVVTNEATTIFTDPDDSNVQYEIQNPQVTTTTKTINQTNNVYWKKIVTVVDKAGGEVLDRLTSLKIAIFKLLDNGGLDPDKVAIGIGQYSSQSGSDNVMWSGGDNRTGKILVPAAKLNSTQIEKLKNAVAGLIGTGGTPTANAYAEAGAYMLGTTSKNSAYSGFDYSVADSIENSKYKSPVKNATTASCDGRGIYFLTDGSPNSAPNPLTIMKNALDTKGSTFDGTSPTDLNSMPQGTSRTCISTDRDGNCIQYGDYNNGMPQVGAFSQALRYATKNPIGQSIRTAVVGFGAEFAVTPQTVVELDKVAVDKNTGEPIKTTAANGTVTYTYEKNPDGTNKKAKYYNCNAITGTDAKNACNWGAKSHPDLGTTASPVGGFGEGGFYSAQSDTDVVDSIKQFVGDLNQTLPSTPSGTIVIPDDPYRADSQLAVAFYPTLQAEVGKSPAIWAGNLKKYSLKEGTLYGKSDSKLFTDIAGSLNPSTEDLWSAINVSGSNNEVTAGGFFSHLKTPNTALQNVRNLYVEDYTSTTDTKLILRKLGVNTAGQVTLDGNIISDSNNFVDTTTYTKERVQTLLQFLGFTLSDAQKTTAIKDLVLTKPTSAVKILGATIHSTPSMVSYSATLDSSGKVTATRDDYVLFGSSDGALHLVGADDYAANNEGGREKFAFIPKAMLLNQAPALVNGQGSATGVPYFGVDAPWLVDATYYYDYNNNKVTVENCPEDKTNDPNNTRDCRNTHVRAYGGLRMGGEGLYGLDLVDKNNPKALFKINPSTTGFSRMGQIWAKPTKAKIKTSATDTGTDVLIFGGGYDTCYENEGFQVGITDTTFTKDVDGNSCSNKSDAKGNAVYIINAKTGALIWSATKAANTVAGATNTTVSTLNNSIVGGITVLDRNNDGYMDQLYFADMGGQVFRADFTNAGFIKPVSSGTAAPETSFSNTRVVRLLQPAFTGADIKYNHRFYERPVVSFYRGDSTFNNSRLFAVVNVISGDRSSPLSKLRASDAYADRLYGIMDTDVTLADSILYASDFTTRKESTATDAPKVQKVVDLTANTTTASDLLALPTVTADYNLATKRSAITSVKAKRGWYYPLTRFDGFDKVKYTKGVGKSEVIDSFLYTTVYNPDMTYGATQACAAKVTGGSERQLYCLPFGVCVKEVGESDEYAASKNGTGGFVRAGQGIQELTLGPRSSTRQNQKLLIGTSTLTERASGRFGFGEDGDKSLTGGTNTVTTGLDSASQTTAVKTTGDGSAAENIFNERYTLLPSKWFEINK